MKALTRVAESACVEAGMVPMAVITGAPGVGKSTLALHWAHQNMDAFPDGQIYVNLRGSDLAESSLGSAAAIRSIVDALGAPAHSVPLEPQAQAAFYRSLVAGRRVLIVLDNARDVEHVRPLLPGSTGPVVVISSRNELTGLVAIEGAQPVRLALLGRSESRQLIRGHLGIGPVTQQADAVAELIELCGRLPLALSIVAARAATRPDIPLSALVTQLRDARLDVLSTGEAAGDLRAIFSYSNAQLGAAAARMFRCIGLHPGPDIATDAAASLAHIPRDQARKLLEQLTREHLLTERRTQRWEIHDLLRAYAAEQATNHHSDSERHSAVHRLLDYYLHAAHAAARLLEPACEPLRLPALTDALIPDEVTDDEGARQWFATEYRTLLNLIDQAAASGHEAYAWQIAATMVPWCSRRGLWADLATAHHTALEAARQAGDMEGQAHAHCFLGRASGVLGSHDEADMHLRQSLELFRELGGWGGRASIHRAFTLEFDRQNQHRLALHHTQRFLEAMQAAGDRVGVAVGLNNLGWCHAQLGDHTQALRWCHQALKLSQELGYRLGEARTWDSLGYANHHLGRLEQAADCYRHALNLYQQLDDQHELAATLDRLGDTQAAANHPDTARSSWRRAMSIFDDMHLPAAHHIRDKIHRPVSRALNAAGPLPHSRLNTPVVEGAGFMGLSI
jgi:tetratricopeptide (TPR) repeat protein